MNFDLGFFVLLGLVIAILVVYRQLDKNNRSLEKIRKYAESVKAELNTFVEERTASLKDFETELKVHDKTAAEILRRIQAVEGSLLERVPEMESMQTRLDRYAASLKDLDSLSSRVDENLSRLQTESEFVDKVGRRIKLAGEQMNALETSMVQLHEEFAAQNRLEVEALRADTMAVFEAQTKTYVAKLEEAKEQVDGFRAYVGALDAQKVEFLEQAQRVLDEQFLKQMNSAAQQTESLSLDVLKKMDERIAGLASQSEDRLRADLANLNNRLHGEVADMQNLLEAVKSDASTLRTETEDETARLRATLQETSAEVGAQMLALTAQLKSDTELKIAQTRREATENADELRTELMRTLDLDRQSAQALMTEVQKTLSTVKKEGQEREASLLSGFEARLKEYEGAFGYRLQKLEEVGRDVSLLDQNLREAMERVSGRVQEDFRVFDKGMQERRETEQKALEERFVHLRTAMAGLEKDLDDLKERAYDNVSEKLQGFEEEFFQDLQKRNLQMQQSFNDWQANVEGRLREMGAKTELERQEAEKTFGEVLRTRLAELQLSAQAQFDRTESQIEEGRKRLESQVQAQGELVEQTKLKLREEVAELERVSRSRFEQEFARHEIDVRESLTRLDREMENRTKALTDTLDLSKNEWQATLDATQSELSIWQSKLEQKVKELENDLGDQYRSLRQAMTEKMTSLVEEFHSQREDLVTRTSEERLALKAELGQLRQGIEELEGALRSKTDSALETFRSEYEGFFQDIQKKNRELGSDVELKLRDYRNQVQDTREKAEASQKKIFGRIEDQANLLSINLEEIDKRQKAFISQTKIFERTDQLKQELQEAIEDLQNDMAKVDVQRKDLFEVEAQIARIKKMGDEASEKLNRFVSEKKRIDGLDADFQKILSLSQNIEFRLDQVNSSTDLLQDIQLKIHKLEDYSKDVENRYERLERRRDVLDSTSDGVDRNFSLLEKIEKSVKTLASDVNQMPSEVEELRKRMKVLTQGKDEVDRALERLNQLDQVLRDVEGRIARMEEARDWIARTESRLQEANKEAEDQLRTLATLNRSSAAPSTSSSGKGGVNPDLRQTVVKLARQGWAKEEIAKATKLSQGEVELILELVGR